MRFKPYVLGLFLFAGSGNAQAQVADFSDTLQLQPGEPLLCLSQRFIFPSTLELRAGDTVIDPSVYTLDPKSGCLTLYLRPSEIAEAALVATYQTLATRPQSSYQRFPDPWLTGPEITVPPPVTFAPSGPPTEGLNVTGSQTLGITLGNRRDAKVNQSLDVRIHGRVGANAEVVAMLSDQDIPFQPEGNTAELEELDKVFLEFKTPRVRAGLGDVELQHRGPRFLEFQRRAEGIQGEAEWMGATTRASFGSLRGEFKRIEFFGQDGLQGPYSLDASGARSVIVAGSETVWLDGVSLDRGEDRDYVIDYNRGEVTFTSARPITVHSRITVDYEVGDGSYKRSILFAGTETRALGEWSRLGFTFFSEGDDVDRALGGELSDADRAQLASLGDASQTVGSGVRYVGPGEGGLYKQVVDTVENKAIFVFVDVGGEYEVDFAFVGEGNGDYAEDPVNASEERPVFIHVGEGRGDHIVKRDLPAPATTRVMDMAWFGEGSAGSFRMEGALSSRDLNTLSSMGDEDNEGQALWVEGRLDTLKVGDAVYVRPSLMHRSVDAEFHSVSPYQESFQGWSWNLPATPTAGDQVTLARNETGVGRSLRLHNEVGRLDLADTMQAVRHQHGLQWVDSNARVRARWLDVANREDGRITGDMERGTADLRWTRWKVEPYLDVLTESRRPAGSVRSTRSKAWNLGVSAPLGSDRFVLDTRVGSREDEARVDSLGGWNRERTESSLAAEVKGSAGQLTVATRYENRRVERQGTETHHLGRVDLRHQAGRGAWSAQTTWDVGQESLSRSGKSIVPDSTGFFDQFGNYVGSGGGYDVRFVQNPGEADRTTQLRMTTRTRWSPRTQGEWPNWLRHIAWDGFVSLRQASLESGLGTVLSPGEILNPDHVIDGVFRSQQTLRFLPHNRVFGFRVRHQVSDRVYRHRAVDGEQGLVEESRSRDVALTVRHQPESRWSLELEGAREQRREVVRTPNDADLLRETIRRRGELTGSRRFQGLGRNGSLSVTVGFSTERGDERLAEGWETTPRVRMSFSQRGRIEASASWRSLTVDRGFIGVTGPGAPTLTPGWDLNVRGEVRLWEGVKMSSTLRYDRPRDLRAITEGRFEVRGAF